MVKDTPPPEAPDVAPTPEEPAPGPASEEPPGEEFVYKMDGPSTPGAGGMAVARGTTSGVFQGVKGGKGTGKGGGGDDDDQGTVLAPVTSIKQMPVPLGEHDRLSDYKYPDEARRLGIEGVVAVSLVVGADGRVADLKVVEGLGHGLDEEARKLARKLRFKPAVNTKGDAVAVRITWKFTFALPK